jgi:isopentenyl-diphosphate delta-isomerase
MTEVILVDKEDKPSGTAEKMEAHRKGLLHRAFSIFIFNSKGEMLLQQRAISKYHSGGLWTNTCCSHPAPGEETMTAATRRMEEEMGIAPPVEKIFDFIYQAELENGLIEHEFDHVLAGEYDGPVNVNKEEVMDYCFKPLSAIRDSLQSHPQKYTAWFRIAFPRVEKWWALRYNEKVA